MLRKKSRIFLVIILVTSIFSVTLFSNSLKYTSNTEASPDKTIELFDLKSSGPQINITTPENKTYVEPMSGYYPATYGFENDDINSIPEEWSDLSDPSTSATIIASQSEHNKVLKLQDNSGSGWARMYQIFNDGGKQSGTVELFVRKNFDSGASGICIQLLDSSQTAMYIYADASNDGRFVHYNGMENEFSPGLYSDDTWFHIRVDFETGMGGYQGLNPDTFDLYINGVKRVSDNPFWNPTTEVTRLYLFTQNINTGSWYADAIGYSWDPNYNIGDNLDEGLLVSFDLGFSPDWLGYSLDSQSNKTILGNSTIKMPSNGLHSVQVFANDSLGRMYQSGITYFSILIEPPPTYPGEEESHIILIIIISVAVGVGAMGLVTVGVIYKRKHVPSRDTKPKGTKRTKIRKKKPIVEEPILSCPFCQAELPGDQKYCFYCGAKIKE